MKFEFHSRRGIQNFHFVFIYGASSRLVRRLMGYILSIPNFKGSGEDRGGYAADPGRGVSSAQGRRFECDRMYIFESYFVEAY